MATGKHWKEERRRLSAAACEDQMHVRRKEAAAAAAAGPGVCGAAPLISLKAFIGSCGRAADEELHRRPEESQRKWKLVRGGVDEIITQLSEFLSGQRLVPL